MPQPNDEAGIQAYAKTSPLLTWLCSTHGGMFVPATGDLYIEGLPESVHQFVLAKPCEALETRFNEEFAGAGSSIVLSHGTPMKSLQSIIVNGFQPAADTIFGKGLFMAETLAYP